VRRWPTAKDADPISGTASGKLHAEQQVEDGCRRLSRWIKAFFAYMKLDILANLTVESRSSQSWAV
jgi:hypothetical protein